MCISLWSKCLREYFKQHILSPDLKLTFNSRALLELKNSDDWNAERLEKKVYTRTPRKSNPLEPAVGIKFKRPKNMPLLIEI
jgi:hypothetical protein